MVSKDLPCLLKLEPESEVQARATDSPAQKGLALFQANCQRCHLADRRGNPQAAIPALADVGVRLTPEQIRKVIAGGQGPMPGFPKLTAAELDSLMAFLFNPARAASVPAVTANGDRYLSGFGFMIASNGLSPIKPPWSSLTAYDLNAGTIKWQIPLGDVPELAAQGIKNTGSHYPKVGPVVTAGGLIFTGTRDKTVRALEAATGKVLWEAELDAALEGIPAVYEAGGRQYIVFCAAAQVGLTAASQKPVAGSYVAFSLPLR